MTHSVSTHAFSVDTRLNIADVLGESGKTEFRKLKQLMLKSSVTSEGTGKCDAAHVLDPTQCSHVDALITNLIKFQEHEFTVDASNV